MTEVGAYRCYRAAGFRKPLVALEANHILDTFKAYISDPTVSEMIFTL